MPTSSCASARAWVLKPERSRLLAAWWIALNTLLVLAALAARWPPGLTAAIAGTVGLHYIFRRPVSQRALLVYLGRGIWALPETGRFDLRLSATTRRSASWVDLRFVPGGRLVLLADQLEDKHWRRLQAAVGESLVLGA